jgi:hypothetical protein
MPVETWAAPHVRFDSCASWQLPIEERASENENANEAIENIRNRVIDHPLIHNCRPAAVGRQLPIRDHRRFD